MYNIERNNPIFLCVLSAYTVADIEFVCVYVLLHIEYTIQYFRMDSLLMLNYIGMAMLLSNVYVLYQVRPDRVRTHDLQIMTVYFMSLRRLL